jgi:hypothetical protein
VPKADIEWAMEQARANNPAYEECDKYYGGEHPLLFATEKFRNTFGSLFRAFADNLCPAVVDSVADRQRVQGWDGKDAQAVEKLWNAGRMPRISSDLFREARKVGDSYLIVWPDSKGVVRFWMHDADQCSVAYDDEDEPGRIAKASKTWTTQAGLGRMNLYYADPDGHGTIEKWITTRKLTDGTTPKLDQWTTFAPTVDHAWGMPVFHFANNAVLGDMGTSELKDVIPLQNALNKSVCDMLVAGEFIAYPQRWATGLQVEVDEDTGKPKNPPFVPGVDRVWTAAGEVKFGEFSAADLMGFIEAQNSFRAEIARVSGTPSHFLNLDTKWPSGEALRVSEGRLIKRVERCNVSDGDVLIDAMRTGLLMDGTGDMESDIKPVWVNAAPHNPLLDAETQLVKQQVGVSKKKSLSELGYEDTVIEQMMKDNDVEALKQAQQMTSVAPPGGPNAFNRNGSPGQASKPAPLQQQQTKVPIPMPRAGRGETQEG